MISAVKTIGLHYHPFIPISGCFIAQVKQIYENNKVWSVFCLKTFLEKTSVCKLNKCACLNTMPSWAPRFYIKEASLGDTSVFSKLSKRYASPGRPCCRRCCRGWRCCRRWKVPWWIQELGRALWLCLHPTRTPLSLQPNSNQLPSGSSQYCPPRTGQCIILHFQPSFFSPFCLLQFTVPAQWYTLQSPI